MLRAYKYRIYPNKEQEAKILQTMGVCRLVYNMALEIKNHAYQSQRLSVSAFTLQKEFKHLRREYDWIKRVDSQAIIAATNDLEKAFTNFFKGKAGYPKFRKKNDSRSFRCQTGTKRVNFDKGLLSIAKIPNIKIVVSRKFEGRIKNITISRVSTGKFFAAILVDNAIEVPAKAPIDNGNAVGIDLGLKDFAVISNGRRYAAPKFLRNKLERLKCLQRRASRKKRHSENQRKAFKRVALLHEQIANQRNDFLHKLSTELVRDSQATTFCVETLAVKNMMQNPSLALSISDAGWGEFVRMLLYKCNWHGKNLIEISTFAPSSKACSDCGHVYKELTLSEREWTCQNCGVIHDRDLNAAINILNIGFSGRGTPGEPVELLSIDGAVKQELLT
jgi:putative transposase